MEANGSAQMSSRASSALSDLPFTPDDPLDEPTTTAQKRSSPAIALNSTKRPKQDKWAADYVTQNPKSPLVTASLKIKAILAKPEAFDALNPDQRSALMRLMPDYGKHIIHDSDGNPRISPDFMKFDHDWSNGTSRYEEDLAEGRLDPAWITQARVASQRRQNGEFDDYKDQEYEAFWGIKQRIPNHLIAGMSSAVKLEELFRAKVLLEKDLWVYMRKISVGPAVTLVEKEMEVININSKSFAKIAIPPGKSKSLHADGGPVVVDEVTGPSKVEREAIKQHGIKVEDVPNGNAWKSIRVIRHNQDLGTLWDIRQAYHMSKGEGELINSLQGAKAPSNGSGKLFASSRP